MKVTLKQIADATGLSLATVSRVTTGTGYVSDDARRLVEKAIQELGYIKSEKKPVVMHENDDLVMILVGGIKSSLSSNLVEYLVEHLTQKKKRPFVAITLFHPEREMYFLELAKKNRFFGVIAMTITETPKMAEYLKTFPCPIVMLNRYLPSVEMDSLHVDYYKMGFIGTEYLISKGHKQILFIGGNRNSSITQDKQFGFLDCMHSHNLPVSDDMILHINRLIFENGKTIVNTLLQMKELPTAIISSNDISVSIMNDLYHHKIRIPEDISIFTCEDSDLTENCYIPITAMSIDEHQISKEAVKTLMYRYRHPNAPYCHKMYNPHLIERQSVADISCICENL